MRMGLRRFTRFTTGFSKKLSNLMAGVSLHSWEYSLRRKHQSANRTTPAIAAGVAGHFWCIKELVGLLDEDRARSPVA